MQMTPNDHKPALESWQSHAGGGADSETVSWSKMIFADGTTVWTRGGPAADHIFHPVMLKYVMFCVLLYALLHTRAAMEVLALWQIAIYWFGVVIVSTLWLFIAAATSNWLLRAGIIRFIFTPFISLPLIMVNETLFQLYMTWFIGEPYGGLVAFAPYVIRDCIVIILFDIQYGTYVAPHHPAYRLSDPRLDTSVATRAKAPPQVVPAVQGGVALRGAAPVVMVVPAPEVAQVRTAGPAAGAMAAPVEADVPEAVAPVEVAAPATVPATATMPEPAPPTEGEESEAQTEAGLADPGEQTIELAGERIRLSDLLVIRAEDHYVRIHQRGRSMLLRGRFSDVVAGVPPEMGILLNRSVWVAVAGVRSLHRTADHRVMVLAMDDQMHPVARSRKTEVMDFARRHNITIARRKFVETQSG